MGDGEARSFTTPLGTATRTEYSAMLWITVTGPAHTEAEPALVWLGEIECRGTQPDFRRLARPLLGEIFKSFGMHRKRQRFAAALD